MEIKWSEQDTSILSLLAEHRALTIQQLSLISKRSAKGLSRRCSQLKSIGLILAIPRALGRNRGRPENMLALTASGAERLAEEFDSDSEIPATSLAYSPQGDMDHTLLVNWFRIHLMAAAEAAGLEKHDFLAANSPFLPILPDGKQAAFDRILPEPGSDEWCNFIPDGVFTLSRADPPSQKSLLFFLEVDLGTEPVVSVSGGGRDLRQKILNYQMYFRSERYKRYEELWHCRFNGFRLLFLANSPGRKAAICNLVQEMVPSDFIWSADQMAMFENGLGAEIWARGGKDQARHQSILGSLSIPNIPVVDKLT